MKITRVKGIIVSERAYKESSKLLNIITHEYGVIGVIAKGAKRLNSKFYNSTSKLIYADFQINYKENGLSTLISSDIINFYENIKKDLKCVSYAAFICELSLQVRKQNNNEKILDLLIASLDKINEGFDPIVVTNILELKYLSFLGITPNLNSCTLCSSEKILRMLYYVDISKISKIDLSDSVKREVDEFLSEYYDKYTGLYLKSKKLLSSLNNICV